MSKDIWEVEGRDNEERVKRFVDLSLLHTLIIFALKDSEDSSGLAKAVLLEEGDQAEELQYIFNRFCRYNRQYQMNCYVDLFIHGQNRQRPLDPGENTIGKRFNCFNCLLVKLSPDDQYLVRDFEMCIILNLPCTRIEKQYLQQHCSKTVTPSNTFFFRDHFEKKSIDILNSVKEIVY